MRRQQCVGDNGFSIRKCLIDRRTILIAGLCVATVSLPGCRRKVNYESKIKELNATNAQRLATLYRLYQRGNGGRGPKDESAFKQYIGGVSPFMLSRLEVDPAAVDPLFVSERDGQPFVIRYGRMGNDRSGPVPVIFEAEGVDGMRYVASTGNVYEEVDAAAYDQLMKQK